MCSSVQQKEKGKTMKEKEKQDAILFFFSQIKD